MMNQPHPDTEKIPTPTDTLSNDSIGITTTDTIETVEPSEPYEPAQWAYEQTLVFRDSTALYALFDNHGYINTGGAHGGILGRGDLLFRRSDGKLITEFFVPGAVKNMQHIIRKGLVEYFKECNTDGVTEANVHEQLLIETRLIPLPASWLPCPSKDGLIFTYEQYEIACYAMGMPSFVVPYEEVKPYLTGEVKELLGL